MPGVHWKHTETYPISAGEIPEAETLCSLLNGILKQRVPRDRTLS